MHEAWRREALGRYFFEKVPRALWEQVYERVSPVINENRELALFCDAEENPAPGKHRKKKFTLDDALDWDQKKREEDEKFRTERDNSSWFTKP